ncbi:MAG: hypothetical protein IT437_03500 [Phycisphaerales bacterium]|nr:hypothetical protein [Phycisphaerales bacterium]
MHDNLHPRQRWPTTLGWACYLACSWTWCIGMFLPVLLVRDFGPWGFVVFAVPNVVGAAAMGWVLSRGAADRIGAVHAFAVRMFSVVTVLFQAFFLVWLVGANRKDSAFSWTVIAALASVVVADFAWARGAIHRRMVLAACTLAVSLAVGIIVVSAPAPATAPAPRSLDVLALAPVCCFGFLLCPYLDTTFLHAAGAQARRERRASFTIGFTVLFAAMILLTLLYSGFFLVGTAIIRPAGGSLLRAALAAHLGVQLAFTIIVHPRGNTPGNPFGAAGFILVLAVIAAGIVAPGSLATPEFGETVYRCFMGFYGLVFPAYVWLCMIPTRDGHSGTDGRSGRRKLMTWTVAVAVAAPAFWMGFIERQTWWLVPGLAVVLLARLLVPRSGGGVPSKPSPACPPLSAATSPD